MKKRPRDSQRKKLYTAEDSIRAAKEPAFGGMITTWAYFDRVRFDKWFIRHYGNWSFVITDGRGTTSARGSYRGKNITGHHVGDINLPRWSRRPLTILHEIAHAVSRQQHGYDEPGHGRSFAALYLKLVAHFLGVDAGQQLKAAFKTNRVKYTPKRQLSPQRLAELRERGRQLAAAKREVTA